MEKALFFDAQIQNNQADRVYSAADIAAFQRAYYDDGVLSANALAVSKGIGMTLKVSAGAAVVSGYTYILDAQKNLSLDAATSLPRVDLVVLRLDLGSRSISPTVIKGTASIAPATPSHLTSGTKIDLPLAKIEIPALVSSATSGTLTDLRTFAAMKPMKAPIQEIVSDRIGELPMLTAAELASVKALLALISTDGNGCKVLCDDGQYRGTALLERVELVRYTSAGEYEFNTSEYPSANGLYDVEVVGGGGAGGSVLEAYARGGGGGAGAVVTASGIRLPDTPVNVIIGTGGSGIPGTNGGHGSESVFGSIIADGGRGGNGAHYVTGGSGGESSPFYGDSGSDGSRNTANVVNLEECGAGASCILGRGAKGSDYDEVSLGQNASGNGAGGSGAGGSEVMSAILAGGKGSDGAVIVYGYRANTGEKGV